MARTLICLNSGQVVQNVIAALNIRPERTVVFSTADMKLQLLNLRNAMDKIGFAVKAEDIHRVHPTNFETLKSVYAGWLANEHDPEGPYILNATGGTKPMSFVALDVLKALPNFKAVYVDSDKAQAITHFWPEPISVETMAELPSIEIYLASYGFSLERKHAVTYGADYDALWSYIEKHFEPMNKIFSRITSTVPLAMKSRFKSQLKNDLGILAQCGLLERFRPDENGGFIVYPADNAAFRDLIMQNGWIEEYIAWVIRSMNLDEVIRGLIIKSHSDQSASFAEFDLVVRRGLKIFVFECKTGFSDSPQAILHNIESKTRLAAGVFAKPVLVVSNRKLSITNFQQLRAELGRTHIIEPGTLHELRTSLERILNPFAQKT